MEAKEITNDLLWIDVLELREELSIYERDILYMSKHREAIDLDDHITHEFKCSILDHIDEEINSLGSICRDIEKELAHIESFFDSQLNSFESTLGQAE
jgi:hypothetical protein